MGCIVGVKLLGIGVFLGAASTALGVAVGLIGGFSAAALFLAFAADLGIYGNCVIIDHGLGLQTLYGHLSQIDVKPGDTPGKGQIIGRTGTSGLAGGDHLHFDVLISGQQVNPIEWWDPHWIRDNVTDKLVLAGVTISPN